MLQTDVGNEDCMAMRPAGWWGWKLTVNTADKLGAGTEGEILASWKCGDVSMTSASLPLDCRGLLGGLLGGWGEFLEDIFKSDQKCFER